MPKLRWKNFQVDDYARIAMRDGAILAHDTGAGKSLSAFAIPLIKDNINRVLIVAPESLHIQLRETARDFFGITVLPLMSQEQFYDWGLNEKSGPRDKPLFFLTTYQALGHNGADEWPADQDDDGFPIESKQLMARRNQFLTDERSSLLGYEASQGIGLEKRMPHGGIRCVWAPTLSRLIAQSDSFDFVVVDEGVRLQSNDAHIATGVRMLNPRNRLVLSATPIKNRLESLFWLAHWAAGGTEHANARWPYAGTAEDREKFARDHLLTDRYLTREIERKVKTGKKNLSSITRRTARITNLHRLWKIVAPVVLRRRKADFGEDIVPKTTSVVRVPPGTDQQRIYRHYLQNPPKRANALSAAGAQLTLLRQATVAPFTDLMVKEGATSLWSVNPKIVAILNIVQECLARGEQVVIGSNFAEFGTTLHKSLTEAGIWTCLLDGRVDAARRGKLAREFKDGVYSVMIAGLQAMGEGHSFDKCPNLILPSLDWAFDVNSQFVDRVWRMTSTRPVKIYVMIMAGSVDEYLWEVFKEKEDSSQLALDGALHAAEMDEASVEALLAKAIKGFANADTVPESELAAAWPKLRTKLERAQKKFMLTRNSYQQQVLAA